MANKNNKGFTLVELLAVIVILAIILVIAVPQIMDTIKESRKGALISSAKLIASTAETAYISNQTLGIEKNITCSDVAQLNSEDYESCTITFDSNGKAKVTIVGKGKFEGMSVCFGTKENAEVSSECSTDVACFAYEEQVSSFDINEEACKTYFVGQGALIDKAETVCTGGEIKGYTLKDAINEGEESASELETEGVISNVQYEISITGYSDTCPRDVIIPSKIDDNKTVIAIANVAFTTYGVRPNTMEMSAVDKSYEVITLDVGSFNENILLIEDEPRGIGITSVTIPNSVTSIGDYAFAYNQLTSVTIPDSVTSIGGYSFYHNQLTSLTLGNGVKSIAYSAFSDNQLTSVTIPNSVTYIGEYAFSMRTLTNVYLGNTSADIGNCAFGHNLITHNLPDSYRCGPA